MTRQILRNRTPRFKEEFKNSVFAPPPSSTTACPDGSAPDANGNCPPVTQGPKGPPSTNQGTTLSPSTDVNKPSVKDNANPLSPSTSQRVYSPTGGCVPFGPTCIPCDLGLPGGDCIPSGDWRPSSNAPGGGSATPPNVPPPAQGGVIEQPPSNVAPPPSPSSSDNPASNNNLPTPNQNKPKGSDLGQLVGGGGESASKKGSSSNNDNSPTPPACPDKGPIPPNCTLKPKF